VILRLAREQLRSMWRYTAWSAALLAFALALATYAMVTGATVAAQQDASYEFAPKEHSAFFDTIVGPGSAVIDHGTLDVPRLPFDEVRSLVAKASAEVPTTAGVTTAATTGSSKDWLFVAAVSSPIRWQRYLASGSAPGHGEVALSYSVAQTLGIGVGDRITLDTADSRGPKQHMTFVVSGTLKSGTVAPYWTNLPADIYAPWSDAEEIALGLPSWRETDASTGAVTTVISTVVSWNGDSGTLAPYDTGEYWGNQAEGFSLGRAWQDTDQPGYWSIAAAALAVVGMVIAAFGMGRAQAEARTKWAATVRVLGATRRTIAASSMIETTIVSLAGIALGLAAGVAAVAANLAFLRARHPEALLPTGPSVPPVLILLGVGIGLAISAVVALVPAFWTSRVSPVAALKPVTPIGEAAVSREVGVAWPLGIFGAGALAWTALFWVYERGIYKDTDAITVALWIAFVVVAVSAAALLLEGSRALVGRVGALLARGRRPWLIAAGDGLVAHRRTFTFASLSALALTGAMAWAATDSAIRAIDPNVDFGGSGEPPLPSFASWWQDDFQASGRAAGLGIIIGVATVVAVAVTLASRSAFAADAATRSALGLTGAGERAAAATRQWAVMGSAAIGGGLLGWAVRVVVRLGGAALSPRELAYSAHWNLTVAAYGLAGSALMIGVALGVTLAGSLAIGLLTRAGTPIETLRRAAG